MGKCKYCGKDFDSTRAKVAHETHKCRKRPEPECDCKDGGDWEFRSNIVDENGNGVNPKTGKKYRKYCTVCQEVV